MNLSSIINFGKNTSAIAGHARTFLLTALALVNILVVILIVLRLVSAAYQEIDATSIVPATNMASQEIDEMNFAPVVDENEAMSTTSVLPGPVCSEMQVQNQIMKSSLEEDYDVDIDFINQKITKPRGVYSTIIRIANEISETERLNDDDLESIADEVSTEANPVALTNLKDYEVLKAIIGKDTYVLKRISRVYYGDTNDTVITEFNSPYIIEALMTFKNSTDEWIVMEYVGPAITLSNANFTKEEMKLLVFSCLMGLDTIHESGYYHNDLHPRNIVCARNDKGETVGFKIIDFDASTVKNSSQMTPSELYNEVKGILAIVMNYLGHRVNTRPRGVGYMEATRKDITIYGVPLSVTFLEEDSVLADFFMTAKGWVSKPATSITDLLKHQYFTGTSADLFGVKEWTVKEMRPSESSGN